MSVGTRQEFPPAEARETRCGTVCRLALHPAYVPFARAGLEAPRVLIADDYEDAAESLGLLLQCTGAQTEVALDGRKALAVASHWQPDVCVLELQMPGMDGREVARQIRAQSWEVRPLLVALTGWTTPHDRLTALEAGFDHYVTKPVEPSWLVRVIQAHCRAKPR